jgi:cystathionine beta-lyase/cystathionine gamma-synthase
MTHASIPPDVRAARGLSDALVRLSPGCETTSDLVADVLNGLARVDAARPRVATRA